MATVSEKEPFRSAIETGDLVVLNVAVADHGGTIDFHLSEQDLWASTHRDMADRGFGAAQHKITVPVHDAGQDPGALRHAVLVKIDVEGRTGTASSPWGS